MRSKFHLIVACATAILVLGLVTATNLQAGKPSADTAPVYPEYQEELITTESFDTWQYRLVRDGINVLLYIEVTDTSPTGLENFRQANVKLAEELAATNETLSVNIVFDTLLPIDSLSTFTEKYNLTPMNYELRIIDGVGDRVTVFISDASDETANDAYLQSVVSERETESGVADLKGITMIRATMPAINYLALADDPQVFVVDVTPTYAEQHMRNNYSSALNESDYFQIQPVPLYWDVENMHLADDR